MKKCPQCNSVFDDALVYCTHDGTPLIAETFNPPSEFAPPDEEVTVIHRDPIVVDFSEQPLPTEQINYQMPPENAAPIIIEKRRNTGKYLLFLIIGLLLGGGLVLATLLLARQYYAGNNSSIAVKTNTNDVNSANRPAKSPTATPTSMPLNSEHQTRTSEDDEEFNGRVIVSIANVRSAPSKDAPQSDVLPKDDRLKIERRVGDTSPWYYVSCEHGTAGWMHGDTIEFTKNPF